MKRPKPNPPPPPVNERPKCPQCNKPLKPWIKTDWETKPIDGPPIRIATGEMLPQIAQVPTNVRWTGKYDGYGAFCTLRCCEKFANWANKQIRDGKLVERRAGVFARRIKQ